MLSKLTLKSLLLFLLIKSSFTRELNYIEAQTLRLSGYERVEEWVIPFYRYHKNSFPEFKFNIFVSSHPEVKSVIGDIKSKDQDRVQSRLENSFGRPYDASVKVLFGYRFKKISQTIAANAGSAVIVNDPVFPRLNGILYQDYTGTTSYFLNFNKKFSLIPRLIYGRRRILDSSFSALELAGSTPETRLSRRPWKNYLEFSFNSRYHFDSFDLLFEGNSIPISQSEVSYWDTNLGVKTKNLASYLPQSGLKRLDAYLSYSPIYGGDYAVSRTIRVGAGVKLSNDLLIDVFAQDKFSLGLLAKLNTEFFTLSLFTLKRSFDNFGLQNSRQYGIGLTSQYEL